MTRIYDYINVVSRGTVDVRFRDTGLRQTAHLSIVHFSTFVLCKQRSQESTERSMKKKGFL